MAASLAEATNVDLLVLNHLSGPPGRLGQETAREAEKFIRGGTRVLSAFDFLEVAVPREGFQFAEKENNEAVDRLEKSEIPLRGKILSRGSVFPQDEATIASEEARVCAECQLYDKQ